MKNASYRGTAMCVAGCAVRVHPFQGRRNNRRDLCFIAAASAAAALLPSFARAQTKVFQVTAGDYNPTTGILTPDVGPIAALTPGGVTSDVSIVTGATPNGSSALSFDGNAGFNLSSGVNANKNNFTIFAVVLPTSTLNAAAIVSAPQANGGLQYQINPSGDQALFGQNSQVGASASPVNTTGFTLIDATNDPSDIFAPLGVVFNSNGTTVGDSTATGQYIATSQGITAFGASDNGNHTYTDYFSGKIAEVQVYNAALSIAQTESVEDSLMASFGIASFFNWKGGTADFSTASNWDKGTAPSNASTDIAQVNSGTVNITSSLGIMGLRVGSTPNATGTVMQTAGNLTTQTLALGRNGGSGSYYLSGGNISAQSLIVGEIGYGKFVQTAGTVTLGSDLMVTGSSATGSLLDLSGTADLEYNGSFTPIIGFDGYDFNSDKATFNLSGSAVYNDNSKKGLTVGYDLEYGEPTGVVNVFGNASLNLNNNLTVGNTQGSDPTAKLSVFGSGTVTVNNGGVINVGVGGAIGTVSLSGSGTINATGGIWVGSGGGTGELDISGGTLNVGTGNGVGQAFSEFALFGYFSPATVNMTGGIFNVISGGNDLQIAADSGGPTTFTFSGGTVNDSGNTVVGYGDAGVLTISGTAKFNSNTMIVGVLGSTGYQGGGSGTVNLNGGTLSLSDGIVSGDAGGTGVVNLNGGTLQATSDTNELIALDPALAVNVMSGGAIFDSNGYNATVAANLNSGSAHGGVTKIGQGTITLSGTNTYSGTTQVSAGTLIISHSGALPANTAVVIGKGAVLVADSQATISSLSSMNISGSMIVHNGAIGQINASVAAGYKNGAWAGSTTHGAISSTAAAADSSHLTAVGVILNTVDGTVGASALVPTFEGQNVTNTDVLVKYTYYGDANLDGQVNSADYTLIDGGYLSGHTGWFNGDFNYDNVVNGSDYTLIDNAFNMQGAQISSEIASPTAQIGAVSAVPEPTTLGLLGIGAVGLLGRRRRVR